MIPRCERCNRPVDGYTLICDECAQYMNWAQQEKKERVFKRLLPLIAIGGLVLIGYAAYLGNFYWSDYKRQEAEAEKRKANKIKNLTPNQREALEAMEDIRKAEARMKGSMPQLTPEQEKQMQELIKQMEQQKQQQGR